MCFPQVLSMDLMTKPRKTRGKLAAIISSFWQFLNDFSYSMKLVSRNIEIIAMQINRSLKFREIDSLIWKLLKTKIIKFGMYYVRNCPVTESRNYGKLISWNIFSINVEFTIFLNDLFFIKLDLAFFLSVEMILILALINLQKLVCKVDQLVKRRAKSGLIRVKVDWNSAKEFVTEHLDKEIKV